MKRAALNGLLSPPTSKASIATGCSREATRVGLERRIGYGGLLEWSRVQRRVGRRDERRSPRGWMFLREGEVQGVGGASWVCGLPLRFVPKDVGRAVGGVAHLSLQEVLLRSWRAGRLPFFRRGEQDILPELRYVTHLQARRGARLDRRDYREPGPSRRVPSHTSYMAGRQTRLGGSRRRSAPVRAGWPAGLVL